jgi:hypothetical protein
MWLIVTDQAVGLPDDSLPARFLTWLWSHVGLYAVVCLAPTLVFAALHLVDVERHMRMRRHRYRPGRLALADPDQIASLYMMLRQYDRLPPLASTAETVPRMTDR